MRIRVLFIRLFLAIACLSAASISPASSPSSFFQAGRWDLSLGAGYGNFNDNDYLLLGAGVGYFLADGLEGGLSGEAWLGSSPQIYNLSPQIRYVILHWTELKPYVGGFYRRTFYSHTIDAADSAGGRAGLIFPMNERSYLSAGLAYEHVFKCDESFYDGCDTVYPEIGIGFSF